MIDTTSVRDSDLRFELVRLGLDEHVSDRDLNRILEIHGFITTRSVEFGPNRTEERRIAEAMVGVEYAS
jgi:hypothetical protein